MHFAAYGKRRQKSIVRSISERDKSYITSLYTIYRRAHRTRGLIHHQSCTARFETISWGQHQFPTVVYSKSFTLQTLNWTADTRRLTVHCFNIPHTIIVGGVWPCNYTI